MNKIYFVQGLDDLVKSMTISPKERVNLDHIVATVALKYPELWPPEMGDGPHLDTLESQIEDFINCLYVSENFHCIVSEYANTMIDRGTEIRVVNGNCLSIKWLQSDIVALHKNQGHKIIQIEFKNQKYYINDEEKTNTEILSMFESWRQIV